MAFEIEYSYLTKWGEVINRRTVYHKKKKGAIHKFMASFDNSKDIKVIEVKKVIGYFDKGGDYSQFKEEGN